MITYENTKTINDLVQNAGKDYADKVFLRYEENDVVSDITYRQFVNECNSVSAWTKEQDAAIGHRAQVGLLGSSSHHYLAVLLGVMSNGNAAIPLDVQMDVETLADCLNRSDVDILFYDWEHHPLVEGVKKLCPKVRSYISLQHGKHVPCSDNILRDFAGRTVTPNVSENDCAMILFTSGTTGKGKGVMLSNRNLIDNTFCNINYDQNNDEVFLNILPIHHVFCIHSDVLVTMRDGCLLCLNQSGYEQRTGESCRLRKPHQANHLRRRLSDTGAGRKLSGAGHRHRTGVRYVRVFPGYLRRCLGPPGQGGFRGTDRGPL